MSLKSLEGVERKATWNTWLGTYSERWAEKTRCETEKIRWETVSERDSNRQTQQKHTWTWKDSTRPGKIYQWSLYQKRNSGRSP